MWSILYLQFKKCRSMLIESMICLRQRMNIFVNSCNFLKMMVFRLGSFFFVKLFCFFYYYILQLLIKEDLWNICYEMLQQIQYSVMLIIWIFRFVIMRKVKKDKKIVVDEFYLCNKLIVLLCYFYFILLIDNYVEICFMLWCRLGWKLRIFEQSEKI